MGTPFTLAQDPGGRRFETLVKPWEAAHEKTRTLHRARVGKKV
jgi:hypothetical protein